MTLRVVGAGLGRTGTMSLKLAVEKLLGGSCYHMLEVLGRPDHVEIWRGAVQGREADWPALFDGFGACVDWPAAAFWRQIADANPGAVILLSVRDADGWWRSCDRTIFQVMREDMPEGLEPWLSMVREMFERTFTPNFLDADEAMAAFEQHNADVRANAPPDRLVEWHPGDGWEPICKALSVPVPDEEFPHANTTEEFRARAGWS